MINNKPDYDMMGIICKGLISFSVQKCFNGQWLGPNHVNIMALEVEGDFKLQTSTHDGEKKVGTRKVTIPII